VPGRLTSFGIHCERAESSRDRRLRRPRREAGDSGQLLLRAHASVEHLVRARREEHGNQLVRPLAQPGRERDARKAPPQLAHRPAGEGVEDRGIEPSRTCGELCRARGSGELDAVTGPPQPFCQPACSGIVRLRQEQDVHRGQ